MLRASVSIVFFIWCSINCSFLQGQTHQEPGQGNPRLPGYFADPTVKKFGDIYYIYATTDGNGGGFGPSQVWTSKDFVNWSLQDMNWPTTKYYWAPDVTQAADGKYYMYYSVPVEIFGATSASPVGPWTPLLPPGEPVVKNFLVPNVITLDAQTFRDDDNKMYMFWGTWGIYPNHGCGVGLLNPDMKSFDTLAQIPNTVAKEFFEAPFMFKRNGIYYLTYSSGRCEDGTYRVQYAMSKTSPMGPFVFGKNNPILSTNDDGTVHGPGHQSVLQEGNHAYLIYHRHNNPHSGGGYHRQVAADQLTFDAEGNIEKLIPTHTGVGYLAKNSNPSPNLVLGSSVEASSVYSEDFKAQFAIDDHNGTLWKPKNNTSDSWISIDLGKLQPIKSIHTQFEYATWYYQYLLQYSVDGKEWHTYADRSKNTTHGSPMIDVTPVQARFLKLTILNTEFPGLNKGVWNIKVYADDQYHPISGITAKDPANIPHIKPIGNLIDLDASRFDHGTTISEWENTGKLGGAFVAETETMPVAEIIAGKSAVVFPGKTSLRANFKVPESMSGNSSFSVAMWVYNPDIQSEEPILSWTTRGGVDMTNATVGYGSHKSWGAAAHWGWADMPYSILPEAGKWHHLALVFDGTNETLYVDGKVDRKELKMLYIANLRNFMLGTTHDRDVYFSGALASLKVYDVALTTQEVIEQVNTPPASAVAIHLLAARLPYGPLKDWKNEGRLGGSFSIQSTTAAVKDLQGRIAVDIEHGTVMTWNQHDQILQHGQPYTVVMQLLGKTKNAKWHQHIITFDGQHTSTYVDGQLARIDVPSLLNMSNNQVIFNNASQRWKGLSAFTIYRHHLNAGAVAKLYSLNQKNSLKAPVQVAFKKSPIALSTTQAYMAAERPPLPGGIYMYYFTERSMEHGGKGSGWIFENEYTNFKLQPGRRYRYTLKARDNHGNVTETTAPVSVETRPDSFKTYETSFNDHYVFSQDAALTWDGFKGKADTAASKDGFLTLSSTNTKWDGPDQQGPFLYKTVTGDFIAETEVTDVSGLKQQKANGANDAGLMVLATDNTNNLLQNSIFPGWGIGNMVTSLDKNGRTQSNNAAAWKYYPHLQIQRSGNLFYLRGSIDGADWKELPGSPVSRPDIGQQVQVGLFHATYGEQSGFGQFGHFKLIQPK